MNISKQKEFFYKISPENEELDLLVNNKTSYRVAKRVAAEKREKGKRKMKKFMQAGVCAILSYSFFAMGKICFLNYYLGVFLSVIFAFGVLYNVVGSAELPK